MKLVMVDRLFILGPIWGETDSMAQPSLLFRIGVTRPVSAKVLRCCFLFPLLPGQ